MQKANNLNEPNRTTSSQSTLYIKLLGISVSLSRKHERNSVLFRKNTLPACDNYTDLMEMLKELLCPSLNCVQTLHHKHVACH